MPLPFDREFQTTEEQTDVLYSYVAAQEYENVYVPTKIILDFEKGFINACQEIISLYVPVTCCFFHQ